MSLSTRCAPVRPGPLARLVALAAWLTLLACACEEPLPPSDFTREPGSGPRIVWDPSHRPFPEFPLPNDVATAPDPRSPTGVRINASLLAPTLYERALRREFDALDGWGTFMPLSVAFDADLDLADLARRHQGDDFDLRDDAVYLLDLDTGLPVPLDVGNGHFPLTLSNPRGILPNDPRAGGSNLLLATVDEDVNRDGVLSPEEDTNFDGVMQRAAVFPAGARPEDALTTHWEPESRTLILRPMLPLRERTRYAVLVTDRLRGANGAVRSPFPTLAHPAQIEWLRAAQRHLANPELSRRFYGGLAWNPEGAAQSGRVVFAWTFITQTTVSDMVDVYNGLHGRGRLASIAGVAPDFTVQRARSGACTPDQLANRYVLPRAEVQQIIRRFAAQLGFGGAQVDALIASYEWVEYVAIATVQTPYLLGDPRDPDARWDLDAVAASGPPARDTVQMWIFVPRRREPRAVSRGAQPARVRPGRVPGPRVRGVLRAARHRHRRRQRAGPRVSR